MKDFAKRSVVSAISIAAVAACLIVAYQEAFRYVLPLLIGILSAVCASEYIGFAVVKGALPHRTLLPILAGIVTVSFFVKGSPEWLFFLAVLILFAVHFRSTEGSILNLSASCFGLLYIAVPLGMMLGMIYTLGSTEGRIWVAYVLAVTKLTDVGAYIGGNLWGRRKLARTISPGKTVEGAVVGLATAVLVSYGFYLLAGEYLEALPLSKNEALVFGLILGVIGQFGDLAESLLKRDANKKDSNALPGIGGALDAVDSLLFTMPLMYLYLNLFKV